MVTPIKGDFASIPLNAEARKIGNAWDPAKDTAAGEQCKSYGAPAIMRVPGRLHISWADENTLKIETDAGTQTRLLHFIGKPPPRQKPARENLAGIFGRQLGTASTRLGSPWLRTGRDAGRRSWKVA